MSRLSHPSAVESHWVGVLPRLRRYARVLAIERDAADELVERTLTHAHQTRLSARPAASVLPMMGLMHRLHHRDHARDTKEATQPAVAAPAVDTTRGTDLLDLLRQLSTDEREVLLLVAVERLAYDDVATLLELPVAAVIARLVAARARLHALMRPPAES